MAQTDCPTCSGYRLNEQAVSVKIDKHHMGVVTNYSITEAQDFFKHLELTQKEQQIATMMLKAISDRLDFLDNVGLEYLTLSRSSGTLSGGDEPRIRVATPI